MLLRGCLYRGQADAAFFLFRRHIFPVLLVDFTGEAVDHRDVQAAGSA